MAGEGDEDTFFWENEIWAFSNPDKSGGSNENPSKNLQDSNNSNIPTPKEADQDEAAAGPSTAKRKRRNGKQKQPAEVQGNDQAGKLVGGGGGTHESEMHIWIERERRKKMRSMFSNLQALLPQLPPKADKSTIVDEAVNYIRSLQQTLQRLQKQKIEMLHGLTTVNYDGSLIAPNRLGMDSREAFLADHGSSSTQLSNNPNPLAVPRYPAVFRTWAAPNMVLSVCGDKAQINICYPKNPRVLFGSICYLLEKHKLEVVSAHVSCDHFSSMYMIEAQASGAIDQFTGAFSFDDLFQLATGEIMMYMSSLS